MFVLGLDVGLNDLYARLLDVPAQGQPVALGGVCVVPNSPAGYQELCVWLQTHSAVPALTAVVVEYALPGCPRQAAAQATALPFPALFLLPGYE